MWEILGKIRSALPILALIGAFACWYLFTLKLGEVEADRDAWKSKASDLSALLSDQNQAVLLWKTTAKEAQEKMREAQKVADRQVRTSQAQSTAVMAQPVSSKCEDAVRWAAIEGAKLGAQ
jgi:hypothetical protein